MYWHRDGALRYISVCDELEADIIEPVEDFLGFPLTSDQHWRSLLCDVASKSVG